MTELLTTTETQTVTLSAGDFVICYDWHRRNGTLIRNGDAPMVGQVAEISQDSFGSWWLVIALRDTAGRRFLNIHEDVWHGFQDAGAPLVTHVQRGTIAGRRVWQKF